MSLQDGAGNHQASMCRLVSILPATIPAANRSEYDKAALANCSQEAQDLLERMLEKERWMHAYHACSCITDCETMSISRVRCCRIRTQDVSKRLSIQQCLAHPWVTCSETDGCSLSLRTLVQPSPRLVSAGSRYADPRLHHRPWQ